MTRKEAFLKIKEVAALGGFTFLDVIPMFKGVHPETVQSYLKKAYDLGFITVNLDRPLCMYPTNKLISLNA